MNCAVIDRAMLMEHLEQAERHIAQGERHIARQKEIVAELSDQGHDTQASRELLAQFEQMLAIDIGDRDRLRAILAQAE